MATSWIVYTNEHDSDQYYGPYARWDEREKGVPDPRPGENGECDVYFVTLEDAPVGYETKYAELVEAKLEADRCVVFWQLSVGG